MATRASGQLLLRYFSRKQRSWGPCAVSDGPSRSWQSFVVHVNSTNTRILIGNLWISGRGDHARPDGLYPWPLRGQQEAGLLSPKLRRKPTGRTMAPHPCLEPGWYVGWCPCRPGEDRVRIPCCAVAGHLALCVGCLLGSLWQLLCWPPNRASPVSALPVWLRGPEECIPFCKSWVGLWQRQVSPI